MSVNSIDFRQNRTTEATRRPSPAIWADCPVLDLKEDPGKGLYFFDDFQGFPLPGTQTTQIGFGQYKVFATAGSSITRISAVGGVELEGGALSATTDTDNDSATIAQAFPSYFLSNSNGTSGKLWFEVCYAQNSILTNMAAVFLGLAEVEQWTLATGVPFNGGDAITNSASAIGFRIEEDGLGVIDTVVSDRATSFSNIGDTEGGTLVANTFKKLGFVYDPNALTANRIRFYADNLELTTKISGTTLGAYTNLDANPLGFIWATCADSAGTAFAGYLKWVRIAQLMP